MFDNYPAGAANDPNAPWNKKDPIEREFDPEIKVDECSCGFIGNLDSERKLCASCYSLDPDYLDDDDN